MPDANMKPEGALLPLQQYVKRTLKQYFKQLEDAKAHDVYDLVLSQVEPALLEISLQQAAGKQQLAADILGISRSTLRKKLNHYKLKST